MSPVKDGPIIVQNDRTILLETEHKQYEEARDSLIRFAELVKSPEYIHTYRITPLSLWNACAAGVSVEDVITSLQKFSRYDVPQNLIADIDEYMSRYGRIRLLPEDALKNKIDNPNNYLILETKDAPLMTEIRHYKEALELMGDIIDRTHVFVPRTNRGAIKIALINQELPVEDLAGYADGQSYQMENRETLLSGKEFSLRNYQREAIEAFYQSGSTKGGSGVLVLPCGAGKTVIALGAMTKIKMHTLIVVTNITAARQWRREILDKTTVKDEDIGEYSGDIKVIKPITIATYQILTYRKKKTDPFLHFDIFNKYPWGLIIYDEVHLLPAPVFRVCADVQATRRLGLTATLVREDGHEKDVFSLIGPKKYDAPWKTLESEGWIATALCHEIRVRLTDDLRMKYAVANIRRKFRIASENPAKYDILLRLTEKHKDDNILIIGMYLKQLKESAQLLNAPLITGETPQNDREKIYDDFKNGKLKKIVVSRVANFAVDLPDANVAVQISGLYGSRQEEAQRLGRILRPKTDASVANFYSIVTRDTKELDYAGRRQLFLTEQGYQYNIEIADDAIDPRSPERRAQDDYDSDDDDALVDEKIVEKDDTSTKKH